MKYSLTNEVYQYHLYDVVAVTLTMLLCDASVLVKWHNVQNIKN